MVQRCSCILLVEYTKKLTGSKGLPSTDDIAQLICQSELFRDKFSRDDVRKTIESMSNRGLYYMNLEEELGKGVTLALGCDVAETT